jgi:RNA polymerase sigma-70 factor (ECF subfamily)
VNTARTVKLVRRAQRGSCVAFEDLCQLKQRGMVFMARAILHNQQDAEDAAQECMIAMHRKLYSLRDPRAFDGWMLQILRNSCLSILRKNKRECGNETETSNEMYDIKEKDASMIPELCIENKEQQTLLYNTIMGLSKKQRETVFLFYYEGLSYEEIATHTHTTISTVGTNLSKARTTIKKRLTHMQTAYFALHS